VSAWSISSMRPKERRWSFTT